MIKLINMFFRTPSSSPDARKQELNLTIGIILIINLFYFPQTNYPPPRLKKKSGVDF